MSSQEILSQVRTSVIEPFLEILYPHCCILCEHKLQHHETRICARCWDSFPRLLNDHDAYADLREKFHSAGFVNDCLTVFLFEKEGGIQRVIHLLKYSGYTTLGFKLGEEIGKKILGESNFLDAQMLIPVPLHKLKLRERGYNQSECICRGISSVTKIPVRANILVRSRYTTTQTELDISERIDNVSGAFQVREKSRDYITWKKIILVDDVITTGSTINSCASELLKYGANNVLSASVAHAY